MTVTDDGRGRAAPSGGRAAEGQSRTERTLSALAALASRLFGVALVGLSIFVSIETVARKLFNFSFEGADELGGYVLAVGSSLAFAVALVDRAHIRIDVLHQHLPRKVQAVLDWVAALAMAGLGLFIVYVGRFVILDTVEYGSTAPTPWATPLIWPQGLWYGALCLFALVAVILAVRATGLLVRGRIDELSDRFHPKGAIEELQEEISDLERR